MKTTEEVAAQLGIGPSALRKYLSVHPELRPWRKSGRVMFWDKKSIENVIKFRRRREAKGGTPTHKKYKKEVE